MSICPKCGRDLLPCCKQCPAEGHRADCQSEAAQAIRDRLARQALKDLLAREVGK